MSSRKTEDTILALEAAKGNDDALAELVRGHVDGLFAFSAQFTLGDREAAEDIVQETFVKAWQNLKRYDPRYSFKTWLYAIAKNTAFDYLKKRSAVPFSVFGENENGELVFETASTGLSSTDRLALSQTRSQLSADDQRIIDLHYDQGYTFREISGKVGAPANTVKTWHRRAVQKMRRTFDSDYRK